MSLSYKAAIEDTHRRRIVNSTDLHSQLEALHASSFAWAVACSGGDRDEAADVLQATYEKVLNGKARFGGESTLKTWLFGVIRRTGFEAMRRNSRRDSIREALAKEPTPEPWSENSIDVEQIDLALKQLSPQQRQLTHLVFYEGMTVQEAADALEISVGAARQHYARAKQKLRDQLQPMFAES